MIDIVDRTTRSRMMSGIQGKNTKPEILIRSALHKSGYRFRVHYKNLPGKPDIALPKHHALILVHGCFWHGHDCHLFKWPNTNRKFWQDKINANIRRDKMRIAEYSAAGWRCLTAWECAIKGPNKISQSELIEIIKNWIDQGDRNLELRGKILP